MRTALLVTLTCCPPAPEERYASIRRSSSRMQTSTCGAGGRIEQVGERDERGPGRQAESRIPRHGGHMGESKVPTELNPTQKKQSGRRVGGGHHL